MLLLKSLKRVFFPLIALMLSGCGGSNSSSTVAGIFLDSAVEGLNYRTATVSGITGPDGSFRYRPGEIVTFAIGDVVIGAAPGNAIISPLHFAIPFSHTLNIARLLQSLDFDGDLDNGIQITPEIRAEMMGRTLSFTKTAVEFENITQPLFAVLNSKGLFKSGRQAALRSISEAASHLSESLAGMTIQRPPPTFPTYSTITLAPVFPQPAVFPHYTTIFIHPTVFLRITTMHIVQPAVFPHITTMHAQPTVFPLYQSGSYVVSTNSPPPYRHYTSSRFAPTTTLIRPAPSM